MAGFLTGGVSYPAVTRNPRPSACCCRHTRLTVQRFGLCHSHCVSDDKIKPTYHTLHAQIRNVRSEADVGSALVQARECPCTEILQSYPAQPPKNRISMGRALAVLRHVGLTGPLCPLPRPTSWEPCPSTAVSHCPHTQTSSVLRVHKK
jgi:hypothetical protein